MSLLTKPPKGPNGTEERALPAAAGPATKTILGPGSNFEGKLVFEGTVHIDGTFVGEIHSKDTLVILDGARVQGDISVGTLVVSGEVTGNIRARQLVEMHAPARVKGTVQTPVLVVDRGVVFEGQTKMENLEGGKPATPPAPPVAGRA
jgi:cytoskeletal protein CcmA (bactofilin family)